MEYKTDIFILTSEWQDHNNRHFLRFYGLSREGEAAEIIVDNRKPLFFIPRAATLPPTIQAVARKHVALQNFDRQEVDALYFSTYKDLRHAARALKAASIPTYEADVHPEDRFLMERFIYAQATVAGKSVRKNKLITFRNPRLSPCTIFPQFLVASLDIETGVESDRLYSIAAHLWGRGEEQKRVFMLGERFSEINDQLVLYPGQQELMQAFLQWLQSTDPDIIIGWHVAGFDLLFLERKCREWGMPFVLGRENRLGWLRKKNSGGYVAEIPGRVVVDGPMALRGAFYQFEDFQLETVAQELLGTGKTITSEEDKISEIERMFREDKEELARYNLQDCLLVSRIFQKTGLLDLQVRRSQISGLLLNQVGMSNAAFDHYFLPKLHRKGFVALNTEDIVGQGHAAGGYVMEPEPGIYEHVIVLDFKSLYPSIIQSFKIDPLSHLQSEVNPVATPDGYRFSATEHALPEFIDELMSRRAEAKRNGDKYLSHAIKILMNSFYGVMGSHGCRFYHPNLPSAITKTGQWLLRGCREYLENNGYRVLYGDTDSVFVLLKPGESDRVAAVGDDLAHQLNQYWETELKKMGVSSYLEMEYEKHYRKFVLPIARGRGGGARKRYAGVRVDNGEESLEFVGMEYVRSDWTLVAREFQFELYRRLLNGEEVREWVNRLIKSLLAGELDKKLIYHKRLRKNPGEYTKNVSPQVRAARMLKKPVREVRYLITREGPVPIQFNPQNIDYQHYIDKQLRPIADSLLGLTGISFDDLIRPAQLSLF